MKNKKIRGKIQSKYNFCTPIYFLTSTEFFLPSQNSKFGTKSQALYKTMKGRIKMILKNNSENVKVLVRYFESLSIEDNLKLSIIVIQSDLIKLKVDKEKLVDILKNFLCIFDKNYNKNTMISYKDNMDFFILAKVMEMNEKEINNFVFEILYAIREYLYNVCNFM